MTTARICLACRHLAPVACDLPDHETVALDAAGRARLVEAVFGDRDQRAAHLGERLRRHRRAAAAASSSGIAAGAAIGLLVAPWKPVIVAGGVFVGGVVGVLAGVVRRGGPEAGFPRPAVDVPAPPPFARGTIVDAGDDLRSPASGVWCAAWSIALTIARPGGPRVVFRDARTTELAIALDGGARARVPAGPWRPAAPLVPLLDVDDLAIHAHLRAVDPAYAEHDESSPFHHDGADEALLQLGDRVELCGAWHPAPDDQARDALYRDPAATIYLPSGWPALRRAR